MDVPDCLVERCNFLQQAADLPEGSPARLLLPQGAPHDFFVAWLKHAVKELPEVEQRDCTASFKRIMGLGLSTHECVDGIKVKYLCGHTPLLHGLIVSCAVLVCEI